MIKLDTILVPTDFSENAEYAYGHAKAFAKAFDAKILVCYVSDVTVYPVGPGQIPVAWERIEADVQEHVDKEFENVREKFGPEFDVETVRREGSPFVELVRLARDRTVDMIVMSTHGRTGIKHLLLGSTAERVVRKATCPVLTVHPGGRDFTMP